MFRVGISLPAAPGLVPGAGYRMGSRSGVRGGIGEAEPGPGPALAGPIIEGEAVNYGAGDCEENEHECLARL